MRCTATSFRSRCSASGGSAATSSRPCVENGLATFCISFGVPADPYGTRMLKEIAFDSEVVWENGAFNTEGFTFRFYPGRLDQAADPMEIAHWGADAVAYRPQILLWFENLPLASTKFGKIPYVAAVIGDTSGRRRQSRRGVRAAGLSPWVGYTPAQFETVGITDGLVDGGLIIAQDADFLSTIQQFGRFYTQLGYPANRQAADCRPRAAVVPRTSRWTRPR